MNRSCVIAVVFAAMPALASAQTATAPLLVTAQVVRSCRIDVPPAAQPSQLPTLAVSLTCVKSPGAAARVQRPAAPRRTEARGQLVVINF